MTVQYTKTLKLLNQALSTLSVKAKLVVEGSSSQTQNGIYFYDGARGENALIPLTKIDQKLSNLDQPYIQKIQPLLIPNRETKFIPLGQCKEIEKLLGL